MVGIVGILLLGSLFWSALGALFGAFGAATQAVPTPRPVPVLVVTVVPVTPALAVTATPAAPNSTATPVPTIEATPRPSPTGVPDIAGRAPWILLPQPAPGTRVAAGQVTVEARGRGDATITEIRLELDGAARRQHLARLRGHARRRRAAQRQSGRAGRKGPQRLVPLEFRRGPLSSALEQHHCRLRRQRGRCHAQATARRNFTRPQLATEALDAFQLQVPLRSVRGVVHRHDHLRLDLCDDLGSLRRVDGAVPADRHEQDVRVLDARELIARERRRRQVAEVAHGQLLELNHEGGVLDWLRTIGAGGPCRAHAPDQGAADLVLARAAQYPRLPIDTAEPSMVWVIV